MSKEMSPRDKIRAKTIGLPKTFAREKVTWNGVEVEVKQPSMGERNELKEFLEGDGDDINLNNFMIICAIRFTMVPGTDERVFEDSDYKEILEHPTGSFIDTFGPVALRLLNVSVEDAEKN